MKCLWAVLMREVIVDARGEIVAVAWCHLAIVDFTLRIYTE